MTRAALALALLLTACSSPPPASADAGGGPGPVDAGPLPDVVPPPDAGPAVPWSRSPPGGRSPADVPQLVAITFDDNFGLATPGAVGGVNDVVALYQGKLNPAGTGNPDDYDGAPIATSFYHTSIYLVDSSQPVLGGKLGEDQQGRNRAAWRAAFSGGHEAGDHTVNHYNGGVVPLDPDDCCRARNWGVAEWSAEIQACKDALTSPSAGVGAGAADVIGFRTPFLGYNDHTFSALSGLGFVYDTTLPNCFADDEDGGNCSWPYTLDQGSPDVTVLRQKFPESEASPIRFPEVSAHPGLWELPVTTLIVPPDSAAAEYDFTPGLRARVSALAPLPYPTVYEPATGKIAGLDYSLLVDAQVTGDEMRAILSYNLDLHLAGNRAPIVFVAHAHLYAFSSARDNPDTPTLAARDARWKGLSDFVAYARAKPQVRLVSGQQIIRWMQRAASP